MVDIAMSRSMLPKDCASEVLRTLDGGEVMIDFFGVITLIFVLLAFSTLFVSLNKKKKTKTKLILGHLVFVFESTDE
jgi:hypothetical protein